MSRRDPKDTQEHIQALRDSAMPAYNPSVPHVPSEVPISLSSLSTSTDSRRIRSYDAAVLHGLFAHEGSNSPAVKPADPVDLSDPPYDTLFR